MINKCLSDSIACGKSCLFYIMGHSWKQEDIFYSWDRKQFVIYDFS